ncbi:MAG: hypothetical protein ACUVQ6_08740 [Dissulfurimicrobium sp.]|uniref:hypothetical protein n=1 Tax=Dissulfurimicrobium sp. TaxID=2022436 RepID=UPI004048EEBF
MQGLSHAVTSSDNSLESTVKVLVDEIRELKGQLGKRDDELKRLMEETRVLRAGLEEKDKELAEIKQKLAGEGIGGSNKNGNSGPKLAIETDDFKVKFGGQYRINSHTVDSGLERGPSHRLPCQDTAESGFSVLKAVQDPSPVRTRPH